MTVKQARWATLVRCQNCGRFLGWYGLGPVMLLDHPGFRLDSDLVFEAFDGIRLVETARAQDLRGFLTEGLAGVWLATRGPRTGTGLYLEEYASTIYVRVRCKCGPNGRNQKIRLRKVPSLPADRTLYL